MLSLFSSTLLLIVFSSGGINAIDVMRYASVQYTTLYYEFVASSGQFYPSYGDPLSTDWKSTTATTGWTSGFFPGVLWNIIQYNASREALQHAIAVTTTDIAPFANKTDTHDVGFVIMSSFGNAYRHIKTSRLFRLSWSLVHDSLATRYSHRTVRCTRSWNSAKRFS